jgi:hypothetical protein
MRPPTSDPTAGERAREIRAHPAAPHPIVDPTDPRHGTSPGGARAPSGAAGRVLDPTDPAYGELDA